MLVEKTDANEFQVVICNVEECQQLAKAFAKMPPVPACIALVGTLGAGKTQFTRFFGIALGASADEISSPTFVLMHQYQTIPPLCHIDAYRIGDEDEFLEIGIEEVLDAEWVTIIEWADLFPDVLPSDHLRLEFSQVAGSPEQRRILAKANGPRSRTWLTSSMAQIG